MDLITENCPETCSNLGLDCASCVHQAATTVAKICRDLQPQGVHQLFFQLFPSAGCQPMAPVFQAAYSESSRTPKPVVHFTSAAA